MSDSNWVVHKFGGTSVADASRYRGVAEIMKRERGTKKAIVVSAMAKVTDALIELTELARRRDESYVEKLGALRQRHVVAVQDLLQGTARDSLEGVLANDARDITDVLRAIWLGRSCSEQTLELVAGYGELWSAQILGAYLASIGLPVAWLDAREVLTVRPGEIGPVVDWERSRAQCRAWLAEHPCDWLVITGYVASLPDGAPTTLKRNGSDFSGAIFGSLLDASAVTIWTDVDGVLSADPRRVPEAVVLDAMSYDEAMELAYFGAKVLHPRTMAPAVERGIPIWIRNTFHPEHPGTCIHHAPPPARAIDAAHAVKGFSTVDDVALINVEGTGMIGVPGVAQRLFGALREVGVSVILISQASSEHSVCFAVPEKQGDLARETVEHSFRDEIAQGHIQKVERVAGCSILAAVGESMAHTPGVAAKFFAALGRAAVNVRAIAQGSSERNISAVIDRSESTRALRAVHAGFYLSSQTLSVGLIGPGLVGSALLGQIERQIPMLRERFHIDLRVRGIMDSQRMLLGDPSLPLDRWRELLREQGTPNDLDAFARHVRSGHLPQAVIVDCTASEAIAEAYPRFLEHGLHVVTPNKKAGAGPLAHYRDVLSQARRHHREFLYEATVGAGLPVIQTLRDMIRTGDHIQRIEGVLSGTLSYVFNMFDGTRPFSAIVQEARRLGYTEPDPRDDLSGMDVARKLVILARETGRDLDLSDVRVQNLVPEPLRSIADVDAFLTRFAEADGEMERRHREASERGEVLRYVGVLPFDGSPCVELRNYPTMHPFARIRASDNILAFTSERYLQQPLIVQGPGAGPEVTAGGIFADLLRLVANVGVD